MSLSTNSCKEASTFILNQCTSFFSSSVFVSPPKIRPPNNESTPSPVYEVSPRFKPLVDSLDSPQFHRKPLQDITNTIKPRPYEHTKGPVLGWKCTNCGNFNFAGRVCCNLCKNSISQKHDENTAPSSKKPKKKIQERAGDWTCTQCRNLNFAFRDKCNRCGIPKTVSLTIMANYQYQWQALYQFQATNTMYSYFPMYCYHN